MYSYIKISYSKNTGTVSKCSWFINIMFTEDILKIYPHIIIGVVV